MGLNGCYLMICLYELYEVWGTLLKRTGKLRVLPVSTKSVMMKGSVMLLISIIIACGGGRPIRYVDYDVMNRGLPTRKSHDYAYEDDTNDWVEPFSPTGDTSGTRTCAGYFCTWDSHKDVTTEAQQTWIPTESANSGKIICIFLTKKIFCYNRGSSSNPGLPYRTDYWASLRG